MNKNKLAAIITALTLLLVVTTALAGCSGGDSKSSKNESDTSEQSSSKSSSSSDTDLPGYVSEETGSIADYAGFWQSDESEEGADFTGILIPAENSDEARCYDESGRIIDNGYTDYSEQRALGGNPLIVFTFDSLGEFGAYAASSESGERWLDIKFGDKTVTFYYQGETIQ